jgi:DNA repair ATPase RecN
MRSSRRVVVNLRTFPRMILAEFRDKVLKVNLLEAIEQDESVIGEIKGLLRKLCELPSGSKFQSLSHSLGPLLDNINQSFQEKKTDQAHLEEQTRRCDQLLADVSAFNVKFEAFRQETPVVRQKVEEIDVAITKHRAEIQALETQRINLLDKEKLMKQEAQTALQKVRESQRSRQQIQALTENCNALDGKLSNFKSQLDKLLSEFVL